MNLLGSYLDAGSVGRIRRDLGRAIRAAKIYGRCRDCMGPWVLHRCSRNCHGPAVAGVFRLWVHWRHRAWYRLHRPGVDTDEVVPGPSRFSNRTCDYGLWWWRAHRQPAIELIDGPLWRWHRY